MEDVRECGRGWGWGGVGGSLSEEETSEMRTVGEKEHLLRELAEEHARWLVPREGGP